MTVAFALRVRPLGSALHRSNGRCTLGWPHIQTEVSERTPRLSCQTKAQTPRPSYTPMHTQVHGDPQLQGSKCKQCTWVLSPQRFQKAPFQCLLSQWSMAHMGGKVTSKSWVAHHNCPVVHPSSHGEGCMGQSLKRGPLRTDETPKTPRHTMLQMLLLLTFPSFHPIT